MEQIGSAPHTRLFKGSPMRTILSFVITVFVAAFLWATLSSSPAQAVGEFDAHWNGQNSILYDGRNYSEIKLENLKGSHNIPSGSTVYTYRESAGQAQSSNRKAFILYFAPGVDPPTATTARVVTYTLTNNDTLSNPTGGKDIKIEPQGEEDTYSSCNVEGVGWIICPISVFLADSMDTVFTLLSQLVAVQPLMVNDNSSDLFKAWDIMRSIANVAFVIAFLIIIYSQITSVGISNYGLKKILPRLVVAAVLVNLSYFITALAIDLSNILGFSVQNVLYSIRQDTFNITNESFGGTINWGTVTGLILGGGAAGYVATGGVVAALYLLVPLLISLALVLIFIFALLAARQALIIILVIIAPLAFVAYLLPNTEKLFSKWKDLLMTMLIFFPAFSLVFGGSQLAGQIIIQNAGDNIVMVLLGLAVQVAPLVITPLLIKLSGNVLGKVAQIMNDPNKGLVDRAKNWANPRAERAKLNNMNKSSNMKNPFSYGRAALRGLDRNKRAVEQDINTQKQLADNTWHKHNRYKKRHEQMHEAEADKKIIEANNSRHIQEIINKQGSKLHIQNLKLEDANAKLQLENTRTSKQIEDYRSGAMTDLEKRAMTDTQRVLSESLHNTAVAEAATKQGVSSAQYELTRAMNEAMNEESVAGASLRKIAAGVSGKVGETRARAQAVSNLNKLDGDVLKSNIELLKAEASNQGTTIKDFSANILKDVSNGTAVNIDTDKFRAALQLQASEKNMSLFEELRGSLNVDQKIVSEVIADNIGEFKAAGGFHLQADPSLNVAVHGANFATELAKARVATLGNVGADNLAGLKAGWVADFANNVDSNLAAAKDANDFKSINQAYMGIKRALTTPDILARLNDRESELRTIEKALADALGEESLEDPRPTRK